MVALPSTSDIERPLSLGYDAALDDLLLRFVLDGQNRVRIRAAQLDPEVPNISDQPEEFTSHRHAVALKDLTGGSNLFYAHRSDQDEFDSTRFWTSRGIDNSPTRPGETAGIRLLAATENAVASASTNPHMVELDDVIYFADGNQITRVTDVLGAPATTTEDPHTGTQDVLDLAVLGDQVYAACGTDGIGIRDSGGTWSNAASSAANVIGIWSAKGRLIADDDGSVDEVNPTTGAPTTIFNLPAGVTVTDVAEGGAAVIVAATNGILYSLTTDGSGNLQLAAQTPLAPYEFPSCVAIAFGTLLVGTSVATTAGGQLGRLYTAQLGSETEAFGITNLQLIHEFDRSELTTNHAPQTIVQKRNSLYVATAEANGSGSTALHRYHLSTGSITEDLLFSPEAVPFDLAVVNDRIVISRTGQGIDIESDTYVTSGYLISPLFDVFTSEEKSWLEAVVTGDLPDNTVIDLYVSSENAALLDADHSSWTRIQRIQLASTLGLEARIYDLRSRYLAMKLVLRSNPLATSTPIVSSATAFYEFASTQVIVQMPVNVSDRIERPYRKPITLRGWGRRVMQALKARVGDPVTLTLYREQLTVIGTVIDVDTSEIGTGRRAGRPVVSLVTVVGRIEQIGVTTSNFSGTALGVISLDGTVTLGA